MPLAKISSAEAGWRMVGDRDGKLAASRRRRAGASSGSRDGKTLVEFRPLTGRTHQIRVHAREGLASAIVGDRVYGYPGGEMLLHAARLVVPRGTKPTIDVTAPLARTVRRLGGGCRARGCRQRCRRLTCRRTR